MSDHAASGNSRHHAPAPVGYVVKMYPRFSETFVVSEILAHEAAGIPVEIFSLRAPVDTHFQDIIARVRAPVRYIPAERPKGADLWLALEDASEAIPGFWGRLADAKGADARDVYQAAHLARHASRGGIRHLHAHFASVATTVTRLAAAFTGLPFSFTAHAKDIFHESVEPDDLRRKLTAANGVITVSDFNLGHLRRTFGSSAGKVQRVFNGLEMDRFPYEEPGGRAPLIVAVGRLVEKKGFTDLVEACAILARSGREFRCEIIGAGPLETELLARIASLSLQNVVHLLGPRPQQDVIAHVQRAAVFVAPSVDATDGNREGLPTVLLEAMALGTPCVSTDVTGIPEVVRHHDTGLLVPQRNAPALASAIDAVLNDSSLVRQMAQRARTLIEAEFNSEINAARVRALFSGTELVSAEAA